MTELQLKVIKNLLKSETINNNIYKIVDGFINNIRF